jgi:metal-responsive CopG/Arc/MetJ family transcriptional regulator
MARKKIADEAKKSKFTITINKELDEFLSEHLETNTINRSKYIENIIKKDLENRGFDVSPKFDK